MKFDENELRTILASLRYHLNGVDEDVFGCEKFFGERGLENCKEMYEVYIYLLKSSRDLKKLIDKIENV